MKLKQNIDEYKKIKDLKQINLSQPVFYSPKIVSSQEFLISNIKKNSIEFNKAYRPKKNIDELYKKWFNEVVNIKPEHNHSHLLHKNKNKINISQRGNEEFDTVRYKVKNVPSNNYLKNLGKGIKLQLPKIVFNNNQTCQVDTRSFSQRDEKKVNLKFIINKERKYNYISNNY